MLHTVALFSTFPVIEAVKGANQIARYASDTLKLDAFANGDFVAHVILLWNVLKL
jgi:hypothetical protein